MATPPAAGQRRIATRSWLLTSPLLLLALVPLFANFRWASRAGHWFTRDFAVDMLNSVEPYSVLVTDGDNDTFPLWYAQEVEGVRKDVVVACSCLLETDWNVRDSDGTLILTRGRPTGGTRLTFEIAKRRAKPYLVIDLNGSLDETDAHQWIRTNQIAVLNIAGPRESEAPGNACQAATFLRRLLLSNGL